MEKLEPNLHLKKEQFTEWNESVTQQQSTTGFFKTTYSFEGKIYLKKDIIERLEKGWKDRWILLDGHRYNSYRPSYSLIDLEKNSGTMVRLIMTRETGYD
ncbi:MAG: hypothetical protein WC055_02190 [Melioribacteraceae bacterium]